MTYTILKDGLDDITPPDGYMAVATSDLSFIIIRIQGLKGDQEIVCIHE